MVRSERVRKKKKQKKTLLAVMQPNRKQQEAEGREKLNNIKGDIKVVKSGIYVAEKRKVFELMKSNNLDTVKCKLMDARAKCIKTNAGRPSW